MATASQRDHIIPMPVPKNLVGTTWQEHDGYWELDPADVHNACPVTVESDTGYAELNPAEREQKHISDYIGHGAPVQHVRELAQFLFSSSKEDGSQHILASPSVSPDSSLPEARLDGMGTHYQQILVQGHRHDRLSIRDAKQNDIMDIRDTMQNDIMDIRDAKQNDIMDIRDAKQNDIMDIRDAKQNDIMYIRDAKQNIMDIRDAKQNDIMYIRDAKQNDIMDIRDAKQNDIMDIRDAKQNDIMDIRGFIIDADNHYDKITFRKLYHVKVDETEADKPENKD